MDFINKDYTLNEIKIVGRPKNDFEFVSYGKYGDRKYRFTLQSERISGVIDTLPVVASERLLERLISNHAKIKIHGLLSSSNAYSLVETGEKLTYSKELGLHTLDNETIVPACEFLFEYRAKVEEAIKSGKIKSTLFPKITARRLYTSFDEENLNEVNIEGFVCGKKDLRYTPLSNRKIVDFTLAQNESYLPCVAWQKAAEIMNSAPIGSKILLERARFESREYQKPNEDFKRIATEITGGKLTVL